MDFALRLIMSHESCDTEYESHRVRVGGRTLYKSGALGHLGVKRLSSSGGGTRPFLAHQVAMGLFLPVVTYRADLLLPNYRTTQSINSFWHRVCR